MRGNPDHLLLGWLAACNTVTFAAYAYDKRAAKAGKDARGRSKARRVSESTLHVLALLGGFVGGWIGRHALRHKTRKPSFAVVLTLATLIHAALLATRWSGLW